MSLDAATPKLNSISRAPVDARPQAGLAQTGSADYVASRFAMLIRAGSSRSSRGQRSSMTTAVSLHAPHAFRRSGSQR